MKIYYGKEQTNNLVAMTGWRIRKTNFVTQKSLLIMTLDIQRADSQFISSIVEMALVGPEANSPQLFTINSCQHIFVRSSSIAGILMEQIL